MGDHTSDNQIYSHISQYLQQKTFQRQSTSHRPCISSHESFFSLGVLHFNDKIKRRGRQPVPFNNLKARSKFYEPANLGLTVTSNTGCDDANQLHFRLQSALTSVDDLQISLRRTSLYIAFLYIVCQRQSQALWDYSHRPDETYFTSLILQHVIG
jgi:hypothetical protein